MFMFYWQLISCAYLNNELQLKVHVGTPKQTFLERRKGFMFVCVYKVIWLQNVPNLE